jgi:hypothetical protein
MIPRSSTNPLFLLIVIPCMAVFCMAVFFVLFVVEMMELCGVKEE